MSTRESLFGTDGVRDVVGEGVMNPIDISLLALAMIDYQLDRGKTGPLVAAQDTRPSGEELRRAVIAAGLLRRLDVYDLGIIPTPGGQKIAGGLDALVTMVLSASHNSVEYNGLKGMLGNNKPSEEEAAEISERFWELKEKGDVVPLEPALYVERQSDLVRAYPTQVAISIEDEFGKRPLDGKLFVVDGAYGAAQEFTPQILRRLGARVVEYCCDGSGDINDGCGATALEGLKEFLDGRPDITSNPDFVGALANDGDADRMKGVGVLPNGEFVEIDGNHVMGALAQGEPGIVGTEYTNSGLVTWLREQGIGFEYCLNGDRFVTRKLREKQAAGENWTRGGEFSGHHVDTNWLPSGDGVRTAAWFACFAVKQGIDFGGIHRDLPLWTEKMTKIKLSPFQDKDNLLQLPAVREALSRAEEEVGKNGRFVVRFSGTEPLLRVWGEGKDSKQINNVINRLEAVIRAQASADLIEK